MSARAKKTWSWLWIVSLLVATIGVSLHQIYCCCLGKTTTTLFTTTKMDCGKPETTGAVCHDQPNVQKKASCCQQLTAKVAKKTGCTKKTTKVLQMKTHYLVEKPVEKAFDLPLWKNDFPMLRRMFRPVICSVHIFHCALPPPPDSGRDICLRHEFALC